MRYKSCFVGILLVSLILASHSWAGFYGNCENLLATSGHRISDGVRTALLKPVKGAQYEFFIQSSLGRLSLENSLKGTSLKLQHEARTPDFGTDFYLSGNLEELAHWLSRNKFELAYLKNETRIHPEIRNWVKENEARSQDPVDLHFYIYVPPTDPLYTELTNRLVAWETQGLTFKSREADRYFTVMSYQDVKSGAISAPELPQMVSMEITTRFGLAAQVLDALPSDPRIYGALRSRPRPSEQTATTPWLKGLRQAWFTLGEEVLSLLEEGGYLTTEPPQDAPSQSLLVEFFEGVSEEEAMAELASIPGVISVSRGVWKNARILGVELPLRSLPALGQFPFIRKVEINHILRLGG